MMNCLQSIDEIKEEIYVSAQEVVFSRNQSPKNLGFHKARYKLYELAKKKVSPDVIYAVRKDEKLAQLIKQIFPISCKAGIEEECAIADELLQRKHLTFGHIYRNYHGGIYEALINDELAYLEQRDNISISHEHIAYIGGGALPIPAMLLAQRMGCKVTIVDPHKESCEIARKLIHRIGLDHLIQIQNEGGEIFDYKYYSLVIVANWIPEKAGIFLRLREFDNLKYAIFRSAADDTLSFIINDHIQLCDVCDYGFQVSHKIKKRPNLSLVSLILEPAKQKIPCLFQAQKHKAVSRIVDSMTDLIGNTPILRLDPKKTGLKNIDLYAKLEHLNPFGSIKDRTAWGMLKPHIHDIKEKGKSILELSSGNASRGLQAVASIHGVQLETVSNRIRVHEMRDMLLVQGTKITPMGAHVDTSDAYAALEEVDSKAEQNKDIYFYTDQYRNPNNDGTHYLQTGREIVEDLGFVDYFIGSVGTAGSTVGISKRLKEVNADLDITGVISEKDDFIPGIRHKDEIFNVGPFHESLYTRLIDIDVQTAIDGVLELVRNYGIMAGPTSGATYKASLQHLQKIDPHLTEKNKRFLSYVIV